MTSFQRTLVVLWMLILSATTVAQVKEQPAPAVDQPEQVAEQKPALDWRRALGLDDAASSTVNQQKPVPGIFELNGQLFLQWAYKSGFDNSAGNSWNRAYRWGINADYFPTLSAALPMNYREKNNNTFTVQRAFIMIRKQLNDIFSAKVTIDADPAAANNAFIRHAFIQAHYDFGPVAIRGEIGKIATPVIGITDQLSDMRWVGKNALDNAKYYLNGRVFDTPADLGILYGMTILKMVNLQYTLTNGEGFQKDEIYKAKAHTVMLSINPSIFIKEVYANFYGRWEDTNRNEYQLSTAGVPTFAYRGISGSSYLGFGVAWKSDIVRFGINCFFPEQVVARTVYPFSLTDVYQLPMPRSRSHYILVDTWLNVDLGALTPANVLLVGRCIFGREQKNFQVNLRRQHDTLLINAGVGYRVNKNLRFLLMYEHVYYWVQSRLTYPYQRDPTPNRNVYVKTEVQF